MKPSDPVQDFQLEQYHVHLTKIRRAASIGVVLGLTALVGTAQTAPTGSGPDTSVPVVATTTSGSPSFVTYLLNKDESVTYLDGSTIPYQSGCPALASQFVAGGIHPQSILYDPTANLLYIQSPMADGDTGILYETPDPAGDCDPSSVVELIAISGEVGGAPNFSNTMALDSAESNLYVVDSFQGAFPDKLYVLDTLVFGSYSTSFQPRSYQLDSYATYGQLVVDPSSHLVYLPELQQGGDYLNPGTGPGFWVFDPAQSKIVRVLGYVDPTSSSQVDLNAVTMFVAGNGKIIIVNNNPTPTSTYPTNALIELDTTQFSFFSNTQARSGGVTGVYVEPPASAITLYPRHSAFANISAADFNATLGMVYAAAYLEDGNSVVQPTGLALGYDLATPATAEIEYADDVPQPTTFSATTFGPWTQLTYDAYSNRLLFLADAEVAVNGAEVAVTPKLGPADSLEGLIAPTVVTNLNPINGVVNQNSGYIYVSSADSPDSPTPTNQLVYYFAPLTVATGPAADTLTLGGVPATAEVGASLSINVVLQSAATSGTPTGNVIITATPSGGSPQQVAQVSAATALAAGAAGAPVSITLTPAGNYTLAASYAGDANFARATTPSYAIQVQQGGDSIGLNLPTSATSGVAFTLTVFYQALGAIEPPSGNISIFAAANGGTAQLVSAIPASGAAGAGGPGTPVFITLDTPGEYVFSASYPGDVYYPATTSLDADLEVLPVPPTPEGLAILVPGTITSQDPSGGTSGSILSATAFDSQGNLYILDSGLNQLTEYPSGGGASQVIAPQTGGAITLSSPSSVIAEAGGASLLISDRGNNQLVRVDLGSTITVSALPQPILPASSTTCANVVANTTLCEPTGIAEDSSGNIYVSDTGSQHVFKLDPFGFYLATVLSPGASGLVNPLGLAVDASGNLWVANDTGTSSEGSILEVPSTGSVKTIQSGAIVQPYGVAVDPAGDVYFSDASLLNVSVITANYVIYPFAGSGVASDSGDNGPATLAGIAAPLGVTLDSNGNVYIADSAQTTPNGGEIRKVSPSASLLQFGNVQMSIPSSSEQVLLLNGGAASLTITGAAITGANSADFALTNTCPNSLASGLACSLSLIFTPSTAAAESATLTVTDNSGGATGSTQTIALSGTGTAQIPPTFTFIASATNPAVTGFTAGTSVGSQTNPATAGTAKSNSMTVTFMLTAQNGFNAPVTITITPGAVPPMNLAEQPTEVCVDSGGNLLPGATASNPCPNTYLPTTAGTPVYVAFYYGAASSIPTPALQPAKGGKSRIATGGLALSLATLIFGTLLRRRHLLMAAANLTAIVFMILSLGVLVGACGGNNGSTGPTEPSTAVVSSTVTATPSSGTAQTDTVWLTYINP